MISVLFVLFCLVLIMFFVGVPLGYLFGENEEDPTENKKEQYSPGCAFVLSIIVCVVVVSVCDKKAPDADPDFYVKWILISFGCISGFLFLLCIIKALFKKFSN